MTAMMPHMMPRIGIRTPIDCMDGSPSHRVGGAKTFDIACQLPIVVGRQSSPSTGTRSRKVSISACVAASTCSIRCMSAPPPAFTPGAFPRARVPTSPRQREAEHGDDEDDDHGRDVMSITILPDRAASRSPRRDGVRHQLRASRAQSHARSARRRDCSMSATLALSSATSDDAAGGVMPMPCVPIPCIVPKPHCFMRSGSSPQNFGSLR